MKVPNDIPAAYASTLTINPATAYCLLREFETLKPGDVIIQNGANSMVGLAVIQMARDMGVKTINVVRQHRYKFVCVAVIRLSLHVTNALARSGTYVRFTQARGRQGAAAADQPGR